MTSQELLAAISADPDNDGLRLSYAHVVSASESDYAAFIKLQIARLHDERAKRIVVGRPTCEETRLLRIHLVEWGHYFQKFVNMKFDEPSDPGYDFERGFIAFARMEPENFMALGDRLFATAPIQHADLYGGTDPVRPLFADPHLGRLDSLSLRGNKLNDDDARALAASPHIARITWLDLSDNQIGRGGVEALAASPYMRNKIVVVMTGNPCDPIDEPHYDHRVADLTSSTEAKEIEAQLGCVSWFRRRWVEGDPDRYHTRYVDAP